MDGVLHERRGLFDLVEPDVHGAGDVDKDAVRAADRRFKQRRGDRHARGFLRLVLAGCTTDTHVGKTGVLHDRGDVGKVKVDKSGVADQVGNTLHRLTQHIVRDLEGVAEGDFLVGGKFETLIGDDDEGVDLAAQLLNARVSGTHTARTFKLKGLGNDADRQNAGLARDLGNNGGAAGARAAAHAGSDEHHIGILQRLGDLVAALLGSLAPNLGIRSGALTVRQLFADLDLIGCAGNIQRLFICIDCHEIHAARAGTHHAVDHIIAAAANADDLDFYHVFRAGFQSECHVGSSYHLLYEIGEICQPRHNIKCTILYLLYYAFPFRSIVIAHLPQIFIPE